VQLLPDPPGVYRKRSRQKPRFLPAAFGVMSAEIVSTISANQRIGAIAQLGERLLCKQEVAGSIPAGSTRLPAPPATRVMTRAHEETNLGSHVLP
jgi:hypothetical protein